METKTVSPSATQKEVTPSSGFNGLSKVTVNAAPLQAKTVTPGANTQTVKPDSGQYGLSQVEVQGDANFVAGNIKEGVKIFGVTGTNKGATETVVYLEPGNTYTVNMAEALSNSLYAIFFSDDNEDEYEFYIREEGKAQQTITTGGLSGALYKTSATSIGGILASFFGDYRLWMSNNFTMELAYGSSANVTLHIWKA